MSGEIAKRLRDLVPDMEAIAHRMGRREWEAHLFIDAADALDAAEARIKELEGENERLAKLVYVPGVTRCAKCGLRLISSTLDASSGQIAANTSPQQCPNDCGPMWRVTERDAGNEVCDRLEAAESALRVKDEALEEVEAVLALVEHPKVVDPAYGAEVDALGRRIGFGALMSSASASWRQYLSDKGHPLGGEFVAGPCYSTIVRVLGIVRAALARGGRDG
jgi:hypothetical protein